MRRFDDYDVNAGGVPFIRLSTNKVYGDAPNPLNLVEKVTRV